MDFTFRWKTQKELNKDRKKNETVISQLESRHFKKKIWILDGLELAWEEEDIEMFITLWNEGWSLAYICRYFEERDPDDITLLLIHCSRKKLVKPRGRGLHVQVENNFVSNKVKKKRTLWARRV